jgi:acetyl esterase
MDLFGDKNGPSSYHILEDLQLYSKCFFILLLMLVLIHHLTTPYMKYQEGYWLTREAMKWFWSNYISDQTNRKEPKVSPLQASLDQLKGLPPALVINGENDVLCDEGEAYARKLLEAGVRVTAVRYHGTIHDFVMLNAITDDPAPRGAIEQASNMLKMVLSN